MKAREIAKDKATEVKRLNIGKYLKKIGKPLELSGLKKIKNDCMQNNSIGEPTFKIR
ncbi:hypothetical protein REIP_0970 [Rickettsia endosymbiont of Ixodes pacificus]|nr:hypothetical protein REIP_0970 [Rickettsia endosymbiont of Ixodes pacificus]